MIMESFHICMVAMEMGGWQRQRGWEPLGSPHPVSVGWAMTGAELPPCLGMLPGGGCWGGGTGLSSAEDLEPAQPSANHVC